ncbi:hypothetical protein K466DRAFT_599846 [Polyporus arcularius HHB13444]|uniref:SET domain-containing protein n=1 Tax=Polyporus arcularius HHB13444 TaxID=1314778 RepID=A0A5C3PBK7_9APHY|nr:hypothetical protein K466DRAFT_599846 [Polyporus arcularius HHB13444]
MRRGFLSTPREPRKAAPPQAPDIADTRPSTSEPSHKQSPPATSPSTELVPIPARYQIPLPLPDFGPEFTALRVSSLPRGESRPELCTAFAHCGEMLDALLTQFPGWPLSFPPPPPPPPPVYEIVPIQGTGLGMVAIADIAAGSTIVRERPFFVMPGTISANSEEEHLRIMHGLVDFLHPDNKRAFFALRNSKGHTTSSQVKGIMDTNAFIAGPFPTFPAKYAGVARDISRVNHSCNPNAMHSFETATLTHVLRAVHAIRAGEEVTVSYLNDQLGMHDARAATSSSASASRAGSRGRRAW